MKALFFGAVGLVALAVAGPVAAQFGPPPLEADTPVISELVVRAFGGPAWWKVSDKDTTVYIFGDPGALPAGITFDQTLLDRRLTGANRVILPPKFSLGLGLIFAAPGALGLIHDLNDSKKTTLEPSLPAPIRARFAALRQKIGKPETRYGALPPGLAGLALAGDTEKAREKAAPPQKPGPPGVVVGDLVAQAAKRKGVRTESAATYGGTGLALELLRDLKKPGLPCLVSVLDEIERPPLPVESDPSDDPVLRTWAEGDVHPLLERQRHSEHRSNFNVNLEGKTKSVYLHASTPACIQALPVVQRVGDRWVPDATAAVTRALKRPGHAVAVIDIGSLVIKDGVLDRLRRQGFTVTAPNGAD